MADTEQPVTGGGGNTTEGGASEGGVVKKTDEQLKEIAEDKAKRESLVTELKSRLETTKSKVKEKIVAAEHKKELDEIIDLGKQELKRIEKIKDEKDQKEALDELKKSQEKKLDDLFDKIEKEGEMSDGKAESLSKKGGKGDLKKVWEKMTELEGLYMEIKTVCKPGWGKVDVNRLISLYGKWVDGQGELVKMVEKLEYKGPLQIRQFWEEEIGNKIIELKGQAGEVEA